jgi:asparagine synthase (glutamine-hydrolysing)
MCGIGGWLTPAPRIDAADARLAAIVRAINHRGPDGTATLVTDHVGMAHARLALVDLVGGDQPMWSADRSVVIVFNGEIFNYKELRSHYESRGAAFLTQSDTEVILAAYQAEREAGFARLRGMFAFVIWDTVARRALLVRDPLGIKPLFMRKMPDGAISFASEAKGVLAQTSNGARLDAGALHLLLNFRYVPGEATLFEGVRQLVPGECLEWMPGGIARRSEIVSSVPAIEGDLDAVLRDSVHAHLIADVPVGCYLSGGIDSGVIAALARVDGAEVPTFTLNVGDDPAEATNAAATARALGLRNEQADLGGDETRRLPRMLWHLEVPKVNSLQLFRLAELARVRVKAALSGLGGDELFAGYNAHQIVRLCARVPRTPARGAAALLRAILPVTTAFAERDRAIEMCAAIGDWPLVYALLRNVWDRPSLRTWLYGPRMLDATLPDAVDEVRARWPRDGTPLAAMMAFEWRNKMVNDLLWQEDRASMAAGLEVRVPFVDVAVRAAVDRTGAPQLGKKALREVAARHLPAEVLTRPKSGFQLDAPTFFDRNLRQLAETWLSPERVRAYGLFNGTTVEALRRLPVERRHRWHFFMLYLMIQSHMWIEIFERGATPGALEDA